MKKVILLLTIFATITVISSCERTIDCTDASELRQAMRDNVIINCYENE